LSEKTIIQPNGMAEAVGPFSRAGVSGAWAASGTPQAARRTTKTPSGSSVNHNYEN
jgi:hypothetical protein